MQEIYKEVYEKNKKFPSRRKIYWKVAAAWNCDIGVGSVDRGIGMNGSLGMAGGRCSLLVPVVFVVSVAAVIIFIVASPLLSPLLNRS